MKQSDTNRKSNRSSNIFPKELYHYQEEILTKYAVTEATELKDFSLNHIHYILLWIIMFWLKQSPCYSRKR